MRSIFIKKSALLLSTFLMTSACYAAVDHEEGGYAGTTDQGHDAVVYNFLKHFNYEQYYYSYKHQWSTNNNNRVDAMDFAIFGGHGNRWLIAGLDGSVDLSTAGSSSNKGYGDLDAEFIAFESCYVVPSPIEVADWYSNWTKAGGVFDGLHQAVGFHTVSWQSTDQNVSDYFGSRIASGAAVWQAWFDAINTKGRSDEHGSAVMYPPADGDTYASFVADPAIGHTNLRVWYQY
ncbi:MAG: DUF6345 domain-containing protein [Methylococcaceae bacterium]